ncbi:hypothetical protein [Paenibacillus sp. UNC451MF]|uniref:hypothetical protein n=1 Tax=Paenibacillus sp. UNC451MF TaxID=1449063 RepID=UPI000568832B|nr:hypothetical protein [Paenibacillus sp. UNC451MF]
MGQDLRLSNVRIITGRLDAANIHYASGGSGLLYSLGLSDHFRDWDITTDAPFEVIADALQGIPWTDSPSGDYPFASSYRISIPHDTLPIDLFGGFAIHTESGVCRLHSYSTTVWEQIRMGSPLVWAIAYSLMNRQDKALKLFDYLREHGADREQLQRLLEEPLPEVLRSKLLALSSST